MKIITAPHPALRKEADLITVVDKKLHLFIRDLQTTLQNKKNPQGVGLAAPQVDKNWAVFTTMLDNNQGKLQQRIFINPIVTDASDTVILGPNEDDATLEGCLSMPGIYGPVYRHVWTEFTFQTIEDSQLVEKREVFKDFAARVMQHELDHLHGILFTDRSQEDELPVYREHPKTKKLEEIDPELLDLL